MRRWLARVIAIAVIGVASAGCNSTRTSDHRTSATPTDPQADASTTVATTTPFITTMPQECETDWTGGPVAPGLDPLLLTLMDVPRGYATTGPETVNSMPPEFNGAVPQSVPLAYITFTMGRTTNGPSSGIVEALDQTTSPQEATDLLKGVNRLGTECDNGTGTPVDLPGAVPNLVATVFNEGSSIESLLRATAFATKGPFVMEIDWYSEAPVTGSEHAPVLAPLPTAAIMGSVMDAALAHIPG